MSGVRVFPAVVSGSVDAPPSKSYTHRALVAGHLSEREFRIERPLRSDDTSATIRALRALGSRVSLRPGHWWVAPAPDGPPARPSVDCGESGTTLRFASALAALSDRSIRLTGRGRLPRRPMHELARALRSLGASVVLGARGRSLPMTVTGPIHGGRVDLDPSESSQFVSALLFALPTIEPASVVRLTTDPVSAPYIDATLAVLGANGVRVRSTPGRFLIPGGQRYHGRRFLVPGDASSAAYLWAAAAISGGRVTVRGFPRAWPQADLAVLEILERYGASVRRGEDAISVRAGSRLPFRVSLTDAPDLYPLAGVLAASAPGTSRLEGAPQVTAKESDRRSETVRLARSMGARVRKDRGNLVIEGTARPRAFSISSATDHRVVMSAAVGALAGTAASTIGNATAVRKSFPAFWTVLRRIAGPKAVR